MLSDLRHNLREFCMRKSLFAKLSVLLFVFTILPLSFNQGRDNSAIATPDHIALTWTGSPATTLTVTWRTDTTVTDGIVEYQKGAKLSEKARRAKAESRDFVTNLGTVRLFTATLGDLSPNSKYAYRVGGGTQWSDQGTFLTAPKKASAFKFLIFGDSQSSVTGDDPYGAWRKTVHNAFAANPDAKFMVNVGDMADLGQDLAHWNAWFAGAQGVVDRIPEMAVTGNHDSYGSKESSMPQYWMMQWVMPKNGPGALKNRVYSYDYGPAHFVVLDSQQEEQKQYGDILQAQASWLEADLAASKARWKIVFFHKPPYTIHPKRNNKEIREAFCPIMEKYHVDLVFNAHDHGIARTYPIKDGAFMKKPSQGTIYYIAGQSGGKFYKEVQKMDWDVFFYNPIDQPNYVVVEVKDEKIFVKTVKQDGTVIDVFFIDKAKDVSSDAPAKPGAVRPIEEKKAA
jgi:acid phosphatase type 7